MRIGTRQLLLAAMAALSLAVGLGAAGVEPARAQPAPQGTFVTPPAWGPGGLAAVVFSGGTVDQLQDAARQAGAAGAWLQDGLGRFHLLVVDGPAFLANAFRAAFPSGFAGPTNVTLVQPQQPPGTVAPTSVDARPIALRAISDRRWTHPVELGAYPLTAGDTTTLFVVEQAGTVHAVQGATVTTILDIRDRVLTDGSEEGLLSVALDPGYATNRHVWAYYSAPNPRRSVLARFTRAASGPTIDPASQLIVLEVGQPFANHNGGAIRFGPDGMLYLGLGDGGSQGDPNNNAQNLGVLLGKMLRIDVRNASAAQPYGVPSDNPFVGRQGARGEVWAYGFRNPWRSAFDPATGALWVADVGQGAAEEVDVVRAGGNYGWSVLEGNNCFKPATNCPRDGMIAPVASYSHAAGRCSISGGSVYRGASVPEIAGNYVYGDFCSGEVWAIRADAPGTPVRIASDAGSITSFGLDAAGEMYLLAFDAPIRQIVRP